MPSRLEPRSVDVAVAALFALPFAAYVVMLQQWVPATDAQWSVADPILLLLPRTLMLWVVPVWALLLALFWCWVARPTREALRRGALAACCGGAIAALAIAVLRLAVGPVLPWFIPPEESAGPGFVLSMSAGLQEELLCRLVLMPSLYFGLRGRVSESVRAIAAVSATGLVFAMWHALGDSSISATYFGVRFLLPGCFMSVIWLVRPTAIVVGHSTAHLLIPALLVAPAA